MNDQTLHRLYLPFYRETDIPAQTGSDRFFHRAPVSIEDFLETLDADLTKQMARHQKKVDAADEDPSTAVYVYMANNHVCQDVYTDKYAAVAEFLNHPAAAAMAQVQARRPAVDDAATWGLTLDFYGSRLAQQLSETRVRQRFPAFLYMGLDAVYPAACALTRDGRHYDKPGDYSVDTGGLNYYTAKARILLHLIEGRLPAQVKVE